jgi:hypothetical protein
MTHLQHVLSQDRAQPAFVAAVGKLAVPKKKTPPFSPRLSAEERAKLEQAAAGMPLGTYIKAKLFDGDLTPRRVRSATPVKDHAALAHVLGMIGNMRLASNLNQLARSANLGMLPVSPDVEEELTATCAAILAIKAELMRALGYPAEDDE